MPYSHHVPSRSQFLDLVIRSAQKCARRNGKGIYDLGPQLQVARAWPGAAGVCVCVKMPTCATLSLPLILSWHRSQTETLLNSAIKGLHGLPGASIETKPSSWPIFQGKPARRVDLHLIQECSACGEALSPGRHERAHHILEEALLRFGDAGLFSVHEVRDGQTTFQLLVALGTGKSRRSKSGRVRKKSSEPASSTPCRALSATLRPAQTSLAGGALVGPGTLRQATHAFESFRIGTKPSPLEKKTMWQHD